MGFPSCPGEIATEGFSRCPGVAFVEAKAAWMAFRRCSDPADLTVGAGACATALKESPEAKKFGLSRFEVGAKKGRFNERPPKKRGTYMPKTGRSQQTDRAQSKFEAWWRLGRTQADWPGGNQRQRSAFWWEM